METKLLNIILIIIGAISICIGFSIGFYTNINQEFNPDEHVCLMFECVDGTASEDNCCDCNGKCFNFRDKTPCELDPNAKDCACDKYDYELFCEEKEEFIYENYNETIPQCKEGYKEWCYQSDHLVCDCIKSHEPNECEKGNEDYILGDTKEYVNSYGICHDDHGICIGDPEECKKCLKDLRTICREKNECEKNNPDYTFDGRCYGELINSTELCNGRPCEILCSTGWEEFCREKELKDYRCAELKKHLFFNKHITKPRELWECSGTIFKKCMSWDGYYDLEEIYDEAIEKGCKI